jgi:hypothetical protein
LFAVHDAGYLFDMELQSRGSYSRYWIET